jgi:protein ImuA
MADSSTRSLAALRQSLALAGLARASAPAERVAFGTAALDEPLGGGIARAALHEIYARAGADHAAAAGFAAALALRAAGAKPLLWVRQDFLDAESGRLHAPGLAELGLDPSRVLLVRVRDGDGALKAGAEAARCGALGAALIEPWGELRQFDLTASRRLALAAEASGVTTLLLRVAAEPAPSAAATRWQVRALPSRAREAGAPGDPAFSLRLLRHRGGLGECEWRVEWNRERKAFQDRMREHGAGRDSGRDAAPLSRPLVSVPGERAPAAQGVRRAG